MSEIKDIPAFPFEITKGSESVCQGMTLRDWFAGQALIGILCIAKDICERNDVKKLSAEDIAENSYMYADAMLKARSK